MPSYKLDGRTFKTIRGLMTYIAKKHGNASVGGCSPSPERLMRVYAGNTVIAAYHIETPDIRKDTLAVTLA